MGGFALQKQFLLFEERDYCITKMNARFDLSSSYATVLHPCGLETVSLDGQRYLVCGCYELKEDEQVREGCFEVCRLANAKDSNKMKVQEQAHVLRFIGGVLDFKIDDHTILASLSTERYGIFQVSANEGHVRIQQDLEFHMEGAGLFLCADFNCTIHGMDSDIVATTQSSSIFHTKVTSTGIQEISNLSNAHSMLNEPMPIWTVAMDKTLDTNRFVTGGDDCGLRLWDLRSFTQTFVGMSKQHTAGVTSAQWHTHHPHMLVTGSYDETCCVWDARSMKKPVSAISTGGGAWRVKWTRLHGNDTSLLATGMQSGCSAFVLDASTLQPTHTYTYTTSRDSQLIYDVCVLDGQFLCCDFYESNVYVCDFPPES